LTRELFAMKYLIDDVRPGDAFVDANRCDMWLILSIVQKIHGIYDVTIMYNNNVSSHVSIATYRLTSQSEIFWNNVEKFVSS
jgi:hypothetical protein